jgi:regulator of RNase E activity RraA
MEISEMTFNILKMSRCADISDALDSMGLQDIYHMDPTMRPLIPLTRFCGIARTVEYGRTDEKMPNMNYEDFEKLQYAPKRYGGYLFIDNLNKPESFIYEMGNRVWRPNDVLVCTCNGLIGGVIGSENGMKLISEGVVGIVIDGYMRDTEESIIENLPVFSKGISFVHPQGRIQAESYNESIVCAGVLVNPGDVICADNDGIIVVPQKYADEVAFRSYKIQQIDRIQRRKNYEKMGIEFDATVELLPNIKNGFRNTEQF